MSPMPLITSSSRALRSAARLVIALVVVTVVASLVRVGRPIAPPPAPGSYASTPVVPPATTTITVRGLAYWGDTASFRPSTVLRVRLLDLMSDDSTSVVAASTVELPQVRGAFAWSLRVPVAKSRVADEGLLVVSISDDQEVRYFGTQSARPVPPRPSAPDRAGPVAVVPVAPAGIRFVRLHSTAAAAAGA